jgi:hypothetical protein
MDGELKKLAALLSSGKDAPSSSNRIGSQRERPEQGRRVSRPIGSHYKLPGFIMPGQPALAERRRPDRRDFTKSGRQGMCRQPRRPGRCSGASTK